MKKPLKEVIAASTPGPFRANRSCVEGTCPRGIQYGETIAIAQGEVRNTVNAALIAHMRNTYEDLVDALEGAEHLACREALSRANGELGERWVRELAERLKSILAKAQEVEVPE